VEMRRRGRDSHRTGDDEDDGYGDADGEIVAAGTSRSIASGTVSSWRRG